MTVPAIAQVHQGTTLMRLGQGETMFVAQVSLIQFNVNASARVNSSIAKLCAFLLY